MHRNIDFDNKIYISLKYMHKNTNDKTYRPLHALCVEKPSQ